MDTKPKVAFICVHNSCRSQIAEALGKAFYSSVFNSFSAGTKVKAAINPDAVRLIRNLYGIDMEATQKPKLLRELPSVNIVITMGCGVVCPTLPCEQREDWALSDPTGGADSEFLLVIKSIEERLEKLACEITETVSLRE